MKRSWLVTLFALLTSVTVAGTVLAAHLPAVANVTTDSARGTLTEEVKYNADGIKVQTKNPVDIVTIETTFGPGASAGWHHHPGPVFVVIKSGALSVWNESCVKTVHSPGSAFFEAGMEESLLVKNESTTTPALVYATFIVPVGATPLRTGAPHRCGITE